MYEAFQQQIINRLEEITNLLKLIAWFPQTKKEQSKTEKEPEDPNGRILNYLRVIHREERERICDEIWKEVLKTGFGFLNEQEIEKIIKHIRDK